MTTSQMKPWRMVLLLAGMMVLLSACGSDDDDLPLSIDATIDGIALSEATASDPIELDPEEIVQLEATVENGSDQTLDVRHLRLEGEMLSLTFVSYDTQVSHSIAPGQTTIISVPLDLFDLNGQAHGYLRATIRAYDADRERLGSQEFAIDVRGRVLSTMGGFALVLFLATGVGLLAIAWGISTRRLPRNRSVRGLRFAVTGAGIGLLLASAFSVLRIFPLPTSSWVPMVLIPTAAMFAIGFIAPFVADDDEDDDVDFEEELAAATERIAATDTVVDAD